MVKDFYKFAAVILLLVCLPIQGLASVIMPVCQSATTHSSITVSQEVVTHSGLHCDMLANHANHNQYAGHHGSQRLPCDHCVACMAGATLILPTMPEMHSLQLANVLYSQVVTTEYQTVSSQLFHPPRSTSA